MFNYCPKTGRYQIICSREFEMNSKMFNQFITTHTTPFAVFTRLHRCFGAAFFFHSRLFSSLLFCALFALISLWTLSDCGLWTKMMMTKKSKESWSEEKKRNNEVSHCLHSNWNWFKFEESRWFNGLSMILWVGINGTKITIEPHAITVHFEVHFDKFEALFET